MKKFIQGRSNLSVTVYVPFNCSNNCKFCASKAQYKNGVNYDNVYKTLSEFRNSTIKEVVFTGGEPMNNIEKLSKLIDLVDNKDVFINTSFINKNKDAFIELVNSKECIKGVNISRHTQNYEDDLKILCGIAPDKDIAKFNKPVKINSVLYKEDLAEEKVSNIVNRWAALGRNNISVCFRRDFRIKGGLHDLDDPNLLVMNNMFEFLGRTYCNICDTTYYDHSVLNTISYHRGQFVTALNFGSTVEINDIIIDQLGNLYYDWDYKKEELESFKKAFNIGGKALYRENNKSTGYGYCGGGNTGGCGGRIRSTGYGYCGGGTGGCGGWARKDERYSRRDDERCCGGWTKDDNYCGGRW